MSTAQALGFGLANALFCAGNLMVAVTSGAPFNALVMILSGLALADCVRTITAHDRAPSTEETRA